VTTDDESLRAARDEDAENALACTLASDLAGDEWTDEEVLDLARDLFLIRRSDLELQHLVETGVEPSVRTNRRRDGRDTAQEWEHDFGAVIAHLVQDNERAAKILADTRALLAAAQSPGTSRWTDPWEIHDDLHGLHRAEQAEVRRLERILASRKPRPSGFDSAALKDERDRAADRAVVYGRAAAHVRSAVPRIAGLLQGVRGWQIGPGPLNPPRSQQGLAGLVEDLSTLVRECQTVSREITVELSGRTSDVDELLVERVWQALVRHGIRPSAHMGTGAAYSGGALVHACGALRNIDDRLIPLTTWILRARNQISKRQRDPNQRDSRLTDDSLRRAVVAFLKSRGGAVEGTPKEIYDALVVSLGSGSLSPVWEAMWPASPRAFNEALRRILRARRDGESPFRLDRRSDQLRIEL